MQRWDEKSTQIRVAQSVNIAVEIIGNTPHPTNASEIWAQAKALVPKIHADLYLLQKEGIDTEIRIEEKMEEAFRDQQDDDDKDLAGMHAPQVEA